MGMQGLGSLFGFRKNGALSERPEPRLRAPRARPPGRPTPEQALGWLLEGNAQFVSSGAPAPAHAQDEITSLAKGQSPLAVIVGCSDSRTAPEILFDCRLGDLFVVRVAGNSVDSTAMGSIEYAVHHLGCPLVMVLGHGGCGAVGAAVNLVIENSEFEGALESVVLPIVPAVLKAKAAGANDLLNSAVREHVVRVARRLNGCADLAATLTAGRLKVVGGFYDLHSGRVQMLA
jgi:carbonic anhydrase